MSSWNTNPSISSSFPVIHDAAGEARNAIACAMSSGVPFRHLAHVGALRRQPPPEGVGLDRPRQHGVDPDPRGELHRHQPRQLVERGFGQAVGERAPGCVDAGHGRHVDDGGVAVGLEEVRDGEPAQLERDRHVEVERVLDLVDPGVEQGSGERPSGVVDDDVEPAQLAGGAFDELRQQVQVVDVAGYLDGPATVGPHLPGDLRNVSRRPGGQYDVGAGAGEGHCRRRPDSLPRARDDGHAVGEVERRCCALCHGGLPKSCWGRA